MDFSFPKRERIVSRKLIDGLFSKQGSQSSVAFPIRAVWKEVPASSPGSPVSAQILISVPKRHFKHAVDRNRIKRQIREAYRNHKDLLSGRLADSRQLAIAFIWLSDRHLPSSDVEGRVVTLLKHVAAQ